MTFTTKLNVGDTIWHIKDGAIKEITITDITVRYKPHTDQTQQGYIQEVLYGTDDHCATYEAAEGKYWWRTGQEIVNHLTKTIKPKSPKQEMGDKFTKAFERLFNPDLTPKPCTPVLKPEHPNDTQAYDEFFGPTPPYLKREVVRISLPPKPRNELSQLADEL